ncbi:MAG: hypothetical protein V5A68_03150 [Candidatus Thermoplasmatota archaeon]
MSERNCHICGKKFHLKENPSGLVFDDEIFVCETCSSKHDNRDIVDSFDDDMSSTLTGMPISIWLIHHQNRDKDFMSLKNSRMYDSE